MINSIVNIRKELLWIMLSLVIGSIFALLIVPQLILHPTNVNILQGDALQHFLGWEFYRESPWSWPITYTDKLLYPIGTSIVFTDSFPLLSIILKLIRQYLPTPFVWQGSVAIMNSALMFYSGCLFFRILRPHVLFNIIGGLFILFSSTFILRFSGHFTLTSQWLIIFELLLIIKPLVNIKRDIAYQLVLIFIAAGTHPYFVGMLIPLSMALCWKFHTRNTIYYAKYGFIFLGGLLFALFSAWFFGWFSTHSSGATIGYGYYSNNLLALINPVEGSVLIPAMPEGKDQIEGFAYLGLGIILPLLIILSLTPFKKIHSYKTERLGLIIILISFFIFGLSNIIQIGEFHVTIFQVYDGSTLAHILGIYRATGRFIWPLFYMLQFFTLIKLYDLLKNFPNKRMVIFLSLLLLQIIDNSFLIKVIRTNWDNYYHSLPLTADFKNPNWFNLKKFGIQHIFIFDNITDMDLKMKLTLIALQNHLTINDSLIARQSERIIHYNNLQNINFLKQKLLPNTLYIGLPNNGIYFNEYCTLLDQYVICSLNKKIIDSGKPLNLSKQLRIAYNVGMYEKEGTDNNFFYWNKAQSNLFIYHSADVASAVFSASILIPQISNKYYVDVYVNDHYVARIYSANTSQKIKIPIIFSSESTNSLTKISFITNTPALNIPHEHRDLHFQLQNYALLEN